MKKIFFLILLLFTIIVLLPTFLVLCVSRKTSPPSASNNAPFVFVKKADSNLIEKINIETYLYGVVAAEMPASFHSEALKAQAVAARTYIYNHIKNPSPDHPDADVCTDSTHCKAWLSEEKLKTDMGKDWISSYYPKIKNAVDETYGEIILYENEPIEAVFHSTGSGRTENSADVWGGDLPYLRSVESAGDTLSPKFSSTVNVPKTTICETLGVTDCTVYSYERSEGGAVKTVNIGGFLFKGTDIRSYFNLNSANFEIEESADDFVFHVKGNGHGVGMSQYGANAMAENGNAYTEILTTYYTNVAISSAW